jgi:hypothetical protein
MDIERRGGAASGVPRKKLLFGDGQDAKLKSIARYNKVYFQPSLSRYKPSTPPTYMF